MSDEEEMSIDVIPDEEKLSKHGISEDEFFAALESSLENLEVEEGNALAAFDELPLTIGDKEYLLKDLAHYHVSGDLGED